MKFFFPYQINFLIFCTENNLKLLLNKAMKKLLATESSLLVVTTNFGTFHSEEF